MALSGAGMNGYLPITTGSSPGSGCLGRVLRVLHESLIVQREAAGSQCKELTPIRPVGTGTGTYFAAFISPWPGLSLPVKKKER